MSGKANQHIYLFLDRDGTLIVNKHYLCDPEQVEFCEGAVAGLKKLEKLGFEFVVVSNQSGIGRGIFTIEDMRAVHCKIDELLEKEGLKIKEYLFCPHRPEELCNCRKPKVGLLEDFERIQTIDLSNSWVIGDRLCDLELARNFNLNSVWIQNQRHPDEVPRCRKIADVCATSIEEAAHVIIG